MKKIEKLYVILTQQDGEETIASLTMHDGFTFQAVSSKKKLIDLAYQRIKAACPDQLFTIKEFDRSEEIK
jgi:hypothetical protein